MATFHVELVSPEKLLFAGQAESATIPSISGEMTVMAQHAPLMAVLKPGVVSIVDSDHSIRHLFVRGGFADVNLTGLTILAEFALPVEEIDAAALDIQIRETEEDYRDAKDFSEKLAVSDKLVQLRDMRAAAIR